MNSLPFDIPKSLESHVEIFEIDKDKAIHNLERHLRRRGMDAVGHLLLAWFYFNKGDRQHALELATKAKIFAPGSPFFENLAYYFQHPNGFDAYLPADLREPHAIMRTSQKVNRFYVDLDTLITRLSEVESGKIEVKENTPLTSEKKSKGVSDDIATETLARIYEEQEQFAKAIEIYKKIKKRQPEKSDICDEHIKRLKTLQETG